jgi:hypothetical protein
VLSHPLLLQLLWATVSECTEGVQLLVECGCDASAALMWIKTFDSNISEIPEACSHPQAPTNRRSSTGRRSNLVLSQSIVSLSQGLGILSHCVHDFGNFVHEPAVAQLHASEVFTVPQISDIKWTSRVRGVSMQAKRRCILCFFVRTIHSYLQLGWSDWRLTRVHFVTDAAAAASAAAESQTHQKKQTSDGMRLWLPLHKHQVSWPPAMPGDIA